METKNFKIDNYQRNNERTEKKVLNKITLEFFL